MPKCLSLSLDLTASRQVLSVDRKFGMLACLPGLSFSPRVWISHAPHACDFFFFVGARDSSLDPYVQNTFSYLWSHFPNPHTETSSGVASVGGPCGRGLGYI